MDIMWRAWGEIFEANLFLIAGGVTYAILLALFPGLAALVSLYGLVLDASQIEKQVGTLSRSCRRRRSNCWSSSCISSSRPRAVLSA